MKASRVPRVSLRQLMGLLHRDGDALGHHRGVVGNVGVVAQHKLERVLTLGQVDGLFRLPKVEVNVLLGNRLVRLGRLVVKNDVEVPRVRPVRQCRGDAHLLR